MACRWSGMNCNYSLLSGKTWSAVHMVIDLVSIAPAQRHRYRVLDLPGPHPRLQGQEGSQP